MNPLFQNISNNETTEYLHTRTNYKLPNSIFLIWIELSNETDITLLNGDQGVQCLQRKNSMACGKTKQNSALKCRQMLH